MTDNEIIKALECCSTARTADDCERLGCPSFADPQTCIFSDNQKIQGVIDGSLDIINRQKAEIERLQAYHDDMESAIYSFREDHAKVKFFKGEIKSEAIKEFAERLKEDCPANLLVIHFDAIDNLVKEMVGDNNG